MATKLKVCHHAQFTLAREGSHGLYKHQRDKPQPEGNIQTSGTIMAISDTLIMYHDDETNLLCWVPPGDVIKVKSMIEVDGSEMERLLYKDAKAEPPTHPPSVQSIQGKPRGHRKPTDVKVVVDTGGKVTKMDQAVEIVKNNPKATQSQLVDMFVNILGMTTAGAKTYSYTARKKALG